MRRVSLHRLTICLSICVFLGAVPQTPARASDGSLSNGVIAMFPKDVGAFAYADMQAAKKSPVFLALFDQFLPAHFQKFKSFIAGIGIDFDSQIQDIAWGTIETGGSAQVMGVALGHFDPEQMKSQLKQQQVPVSSFQGYDVFAFGTGIGQNDLFFTFLDTDTMAFGTRDGIQRFINVRMNGEQTLLANDALFPMIREANGHGILWGIFDQRHTKLAIDELMPQATAFPQAAAIVKRVHALIVHAASDDGVAVSLEAKCATVDDANLLALALQTEIMYRQYQGASSNSSATDLLSRLSVRPSGEDLNANVTLSQDDLQALAQMQIAIPHL